MFRRRDPAEKDPCDPGRTAESCRSGAPVGIYMETDGVMVIRTAEIRSSDGTVSRPSENILREGDYITKVNGQSIRSKQDLIDAVKVSNGSPVCLSLLRDGKRSKCR